MAPNRRRQLRFSLLAIFMLTGAIAVRAQSVDCQGTIDSWRADANMREYAATCTCPNPDRMPVCRARGGEGNAASRPGANPGNPGTGGANPNNSGADDAARAEAERKRREEEFKSRQEKLRGGLKPGNLANSGNLGLKPSSNIIREQTVKRIKELNCSAFWGIRALNEALELRNAVTPNLEDEYTLTRKYAEFSAQAKGGKSVEGCPEVKISVPDVPPPLESNPQIQFYDQLIDEAQNLLPQVIETNQKMKEEGIRLKYTEDAKTIKAQELEKIIRKPNTPRNRAGKKKISAEYDELKELALQAQRDAEEIQKLADEQSNKAKELQTKFDSRH